jgi:acyl carrier protein
MDEAILEDVRTLVAEQLGVDRSTVNANSSFEEDLRADSQVAQFMDKSR